MEQLLSDILDALGQIFEGLLNLILSPLQAFFAWVVNLGISFVEFLGGVLNFIIEGIRFFAQLSADLISLIVNFFVGSVLLIREFIIIVGLLLSIVFALVALVVKWMVHMASIIGDIMGAFFSASPLPLPGVPQCISNPTVHDLCGVWHLWDNTVFKGNVGAAIVSIILIIIDIVIVFYFAKQVMRFLKMGETVTDVS